MDTGGERWRGLAERVWPYALLVAFALLVAWVYRQPPKLGDDLDYWRLAMELRTGEGDGWRAASFHHLRWPVWGVCWLLMVPFGVTGASYFLQPALYLSLGACLVYWLAGRAGLGLWGRVCAGVFLAMHPLVDTALMRPMPDLSEGFWVALSFGLWLAMVSRGRGAGKVVLCGAVGLVLAVAQANRITGVFAVPVLVVCTLALVPRQFGWLVLCGIFAAGFVLAEAVVYHALTGDLFHTIHANLRATGRKGTDTMALWMFPLRFLGALWRMPHDVLMSSLAVGGAVYFWRGGGLAGRALVLYAAVYYLTYSCALQSLFPPRPMVRDGDRFLASLAFPLSVLAVGGPLLLWSLLPAAVRGLPFVAFWARRPWAGLVALVVLLALLGNRTTGVPDYLREIGAKVRSMPPGAVIVSHPPMRAVAQLAAPRAASRLEWRLFRHILEPSDEVQAATRGADGIWLIRKHAWLSNRKRAETGAQERLEELAPYLVPPLDGWRPALAVLKNDVPDFLFLERCEGDSPLESVAGPAVLPIPATSFPCGWEFPPAPRRWQSGPAPVPESLRGATVFVALRQSSNRTEPARILIAFETTGSRRPTMLSFRPYLFPKTSPDFFAFTIPPDATTSRIEITVAPRTEWIEIESAGLYLARPR
jgi:hypothetical protein